MVHRHKRHSNSRRTTAVASVIAIGFAFTSLVACGSSEGTSSSGTPATDSATVNRAAVALLPDRIRSAGSVELVSDFAYPPYALEDESGEFAGSDYDLMNAVMTRLGLEPKWTKSIGFSTLIPAVENGRADIAVESIAVTDERLNTVSFVTYQTATDYLIVAAGNPSDLDPTNLCGSELATQTGAVEGTMLKDLSKECVAEGREPIKQSFFSDNKAALQAVMSGQAQGLVEGRASAVYDTDLSNGALEMLDSSPVTKVDGTTPMARYVLGVAVQRSPEGTALGKAIEKVIADMQKDGSYAEVMEPWELEGEEYPAKFIDDPGQLTQ